MRVAANGLDRGAEVVRSVPEVAGDCESAGGCEKRACWRGVMMML